MSETTTRYDDVSAIGPLTERRTFTAIYVQTDTAWIAYVLELPNVFTQGATLDDARVMLEDALHLMLDVHRDDVEQTIAEVLPERPQLREDITVIRP